MMKRFANGIDAATSAARDIVTLPLVLERTAGVSSFEVRSLRYYVLAGMPCTGSTSNKYVACMCLLCNSSLENS
jgi:hypothetical protein